MTTTIIIWVKVCRRWKTQTFWRNLSYFLTSWLNWLITNRWRWLFTGWWRLLVKSRFITVGGLQFFVFKILQSSSGVPLPCRRGFPFSHSRYPSWRCSQFSIVAKRKCKQPRGKLEIESNPLIRQCLGKIQTLCYKGWVSSNHSGCWCRHVNCGKQEG